MGTAEYLRRTRLQRQLVAAGSADLSAIVGTLLAVQAQSWRGACLSVSVRAAHGALREMHEMIAAGDLVVSWLNRGTLHLVRRNDFYWLHELTMPQKDNAIRYGLRRAGIDDEFSDELVTQLVTAIEGNARTKAEIASHLDLPVGSRRPNIVGHVFELAAQQGLLVRGPFRGAEATYELSQSWVGPRPVLAPRVELLRQLVERYQASHWPSEPADLARWAGLPLIEVKQAWWQVDPPDETDFGAPFTGLLGPFDTAVMGWTKRDWLLGDWEAQVVTTNGIFRPVAVVDDRCAGTWTAPNGRFELTLFERINAKQQARLDADAARVLDIGREIGTRD